MFSRLTGRKTQDNAPASPAPQRSSVKAGQPGVPLELVRYDTNTGKFHAGEEALKTLRATSQPIGVVAVCGRARQGKSFILNQLLGQSTGFQVAPTVRPCTKGLWMWSAPIRRTAADGSQHQLVLLDSEGIDAWDQTGQYSTQIFSLAVLLSSLFVYNQMGGIDEAALDRLSLVTEMTKHIRVKSGESSEAELASFTPAFLWLLRDFYLSLEEDGHQVSAREYLETALKSVAGTSSAAQAKNQIRESIKALFPDRDCFPLVRPMSDEKALAKLETLDTKEMRPEFQEGVKTLIQLIFNKAQPKRMQNSVVTGPVLAALVTAYVDAINKGAVPTIATAWQGVAEAESRRAADIAEAAYQQAFNRDIPADEAALDREYTKALSAGQAAFREVAVGDKTIQQANERRFEDRVQQLFQQFREQRLTSAALECEELINKASSRLTVLSREPSTTPDILQQEYAKFERAFTQSTAGTGPMKWQRLNDFRLGAYAALQRDVQQRLEQKAQQELAAERQRAQQAQQQYQQGETRATELQQQVQRQQADLDRLHADLAHARSSGQRSTSRVSALEKQLQDKSSALDAAQQELQQAVQRERQGSEAAQRQLNLQLQQLTTQLSDAQRARNTAELEAESLRGQLSSASLESSSKYQRADAGRLAAEAETEKVKTDLQARLSQAEQRAVSAEAAVSKGQQEMQQLQRRLSEAESRARSAAANQASAPPPETDVVMDGSGDGSIQPDKMTKEQLKSWLNEHEFYEEIQVLNQNKKAKKQDWVDTVRRVM